MKKIRIHINLVSKYLEWEEMGKVETVQKRLKKDMKYCKKNRQCMEYGAHLVNPELVQFIRVTGADHQ